MKYSGRIILVTFGLVLILAIRLYAVYYYHYDLTQFPLFVIPIVLIFWWLGKQYDSVKFLSERDTLTKIYNRRYVIHTFPKLLASIDKKKAKLSLLLFDLDNFKLINDTYGHETGDKVLQHFSNLLLIHTSKKEIAVRWAGDEFLLIVPDVDEEGTDNRIRRIHEELKQSAELLELEFTVSIGASEYPNEAKTLKDLLHIADQNMYRMKYRKDSPLES
jgi:diguanylate cyclase (GGDEF)-like protein